MKLNDSCIARRRFLASMIGGGAAALGTGVAVPVVCYVGNLREEPPPDFIRIDKAHFDLAPGTSKLIPYGNKPLLLLQPPQEGEELRVFLATCTHLDCIVSYQKNADHIDCACHGGRFTLDGKVIAGPPPSPLRRCFTMPDGDGLVIALEKENLEKAFAEPDA